MLIQHIQELENEYRQSCHVAKNSNGAVNAFREWIDAVIGLLGYYFPADNADFCRIKNEDFTGNGYELNRVYRSISPICHLMIGQIESGKAPLQLQGEARHPVIAGSKQPLVFISHASADKELIDEFMNDILKNGLGLDDSNIVCTSFGKTGVPMGDNIPNYIKDNIEKATVVLAMVSKAYKASEVCQNEVGAAWALGNKPIEIVLPDADFNQLGWLFNLDKAAKISDSSDLDHLQEILSDKLGLKIKTSNQWNPCVNSFLKHIASIQYPCVTTKPDEQPDALEKYDLYKGEKWLKELMGHFSFYYMDTYFQDMPAYFREPLSITFDYWNACLHSSVFQMKDKKLLDLILDFFNSWADIENYGAKYYCTSPNGQLVQFFKLQHDIITDPIAEKDFYIIRKMVDELAPKYKAFRDYLDQNYEIDFAEVSDNFAKAFLSDSLHN